MPTIVLVDDDQNLLHTIRDALEGDGFTVVAFNDSRTAWHTLNDVKPDAAVLDVKMPGMDGMELLTRIRRDSKLPVIFLTSRDDELDELTGLRLGADDYLTKPVSTRVLIARIRALLRRRDLTSTDTATAETFIERGDLRLNPARHECTLKGENVTLTVTEFLILQSLVARPGHLKSRRQLMDAAYGAKIYVDERTIDSHVKRLRSKLKEIDPAFAMIETLYGAGYRYRT